MTALSEDLERRLNCSSPVTKDKIWMTNAGILIRHQKTYIAAPLLPHNNNLNIETPENFIYTSRKITTLAKCFHCVFIS